MNKREGLIVHLEDSSKKSESSKKDIDYGKLGLGVVGFAICSPYMFPTIAGISTATLIPTIASGLTTVGITVLGGIAGYVGIEVLDEILSDSLKSKNKETIEINNKVPSGRLIKTPSNLVTIGLENNETNMKKDKKGVSVC